MTAKTMDAALAEERARGVERLRAGGWRPIDDEARNGEPWAMLTAAGRLVKAEWSLDVVIDCVGDSTDTWVATEEGQHPDCWTNSGDVSAGTRAALRMAMQITSRRMAG